MTSKERVRIALDHEQPDRVPVFASYVPEVEERLRGRFGIDEPDLGVALGNDLVKTCVGMELSFYGSPRPAYTCPWGIRWRYIRNQSGEYTEIEEHPLAGGAGGMETGYAGTVFHGNPRRITACNRPS